MRRPADDDADLDPVTGPSQGGRNDSHNATTDAPRASANKAIVIRLIGEVMNGGRLDVIEELYAPHLQRGARRWIEPFLHAFPDMHMEILALIEEGDVVACRFRCSATHLGVWRGQPATGRRFEQIDEVYFLTIRDGRIAAAWGLEDTHARLNQLGLAPGKQ